MIKLRNIIFILVLVVLILQIAVMTKEDKTESETKKPSVALSSFSLFDIAKFIAEDTQELFMIIPLGADAHSFEPTPKLMAKIYKSDLLIHSGAGLELWIKGLKTNSKIIDMSKYVNLIEIDGGHDEHHEHSHKEDESCNSVDPHYWLDIENMKKSALVVAEELSILSPAHKELYMKNKDIYTGMLDSLDSDYKKELSSCKKSSIIVNHNAFSYLSHRYGFEVEALSGLSPDAEPSAKNMTKLIEHIKEDKISTIFFESFVSDKAIKSIANEAKVDVDVLHPLGNITDDEAKRGLTYEDIMRDNLKKISKALECR